MKMNALEKVAMNNPIRAWIQRTREAPLLQRLGGNLEGLVVLEIGCGGGVGTALLLREFKARKVVAIDVDPDMIRRARRRLAAYGSDALEIRVGDVTAIEEEDESFDAVVDFAIIHHVPDWQKAVYEVSRVLRPGGQFLFEEVTAQWIHRWPYRRLFLHPMENRFNAAEFVLEIESHGILLHGNYVERHGGDFVFGVGRKVNSGIANLQANSAKSSCTGE